MLICIIVYSLARKTKVKKNSSIFPVRFPDMLGFWDSLFLRGGYFSTSEQNTKPTTPFSYPPPPPMRWYYVVKWILVVQLRKWILALLIHSVKTNQWPRQGYKQFISLNRYRRMLFTFNKGFPGILFMTDIYINFRIVNSYVELTIWTNEILFWVVSYHKQRTASLRSTCMYNKRTNYACLEKMSKSFLVQMVFLTHSLHFSNLRTIVPVCRNKGIKNKYFFHVCR